MDHVGFGREGLAEALVHRVRFVQAGAVQELDALDALLGFDPGHQHRDAHTLAGEGGRASHQVGADAAVAHPARHHDQHAAGRDRLRRAHRATRSRRRRCARRRARIRPAGVASCPSPSAPAGAGCAAARAPVRARTRAGGRAGGERVVQPRQLRVAEAGAVVVDHTAVDREEHGVDVARVRAQHLPPGRVRQLELAQQVAADVADAAPEPVLPAVARRPVAAERAPGAHRRHAEQRVRLAVAEVLLAAHREQLRAPAAPRRSGASGRRSGRRRRRGTSAGPPPPPARRSRRPGG